MDIQNYLEKMKKIQEKLLEFLDYEYSVEENFQNLCITLDNAKIGENKHDLRSFLYLLQKISNNHYRANDFFNKIDRILQHFQNEIQKDFSQSEIFDIFKSNKRILLFLFENKLIIMNEFIVKSILKAKYFQSKYFQYFYPEIKPFVNKEWFQKCGRDNWSFIRNYIIERIKKGLPDNFNEKRKIGENDDTICTFIQKDLIEEFIIYVKKNDYSLKSTISPSIYETNSLLLKQTEINLIEYAAFFGSIQIYKYLTLNGVELTKPLWKYAIHGQNAEIVHFLEEGDTCLKKEYFINKCLRQSLICHHIDITNYILNNYVNNEKYDHDDFLIQALICRNFTFLQNDQKFEFLFVYLCRYNYYSIIDILLKEKDIDINKYCILINNHTKMYEKKYIYKTALGAAVEKNNIEIVKLLVANDKLDVNLECII